MTNIREFIKNLGDKAPLFFDTKDTTVARWLKTGSIPMKAVEKVLMASEAMRLTGTTEFTTATPPTAGTPEPLHEVVREPDVDPVTHLPTNIDRKLPQIQALPGHAPQTIEMSPTEQSWGINLTRPGRIQTLPPMKIRKVDGQSIPFVEQPKPITVLPPSIGSDPGWGKPNEPTVKKESTEGVSQEKVS